MDKIQLFIPIILLDAVEREYRYRLETNLKPTGEKIDLSKFSPKKENKQEKILLIDDLADKGWEQVLEETVTKNPIDIAENIEKAKEKIKEKYDLIFLDMRLGETDHKSTLQVEDFGGFNLLKEMKNDFAIEIPYLGGLIATRSLDTEIVGLKEIQAKNEGRVRNGMVAYDLFTQLKAEKKSAGQVNPETKAKFDEVKGDLGFGLLLKRYTDKVVDATDEQIKQAARDTIPNVGPNFWAFRGMLAAGGLIILLTFGAFVQNLRNKVTSSRLLLKALLWGIPLPILAIEFGWFLAEFGRQPWAIYEVLPVGVSASNLSVGDLWFSIGLICVLYFFFIIAEMYLMFKYARLGPSALKTGKYYFEQSSK